MSTKRYDPMEPPFEPGPEDGPEDVILTAPLTHDQAVALAEQYHAAKEAIAQRLETGLHHSLRSMDWTLEYAKKVDRIAFTVWDLAEVFDAGFAAGREEGWREVTGDE